MEKGLKTYWTNMAKCLLIVLMSSFVLTSCVEKDVDVTSVTLDKTTLELTIGGTATLNATVLPSDATDKTVVWTSSNPSVATVSDGLVTAVGAGTATITATAGGKTATCTVAVETPIVVVTSVTLDNPTLDLNIGESSTLVATVAPDNATDKTVTWTTSDATVATVNNGVVSALAEGTATITATSGTQTATCDVTVSSSVAINEITFPDDVFRAYVYNKFDTDKDSVLSGEDIFNARRIGIGGESISNLKGLEYFKYLNSFVCYNNDFNTLDVSENTRLTELHCYQNGLTSLNVLGNTNLKKLYCYGNNLSTLDLSNNTNLEVLVCSNNIISSLNLAANVNLSELNCSYNSISSLDVSNNTQLATIKCNNNVLETLILTNDTLLAYLDCNNNNLTSLNIDDNPNLIRLFCDNNNIESLSVNNAFIRFLSCQNNVISSLDLSEDVRLGYLYCNDNNLSTLDISNTIVSIDSSSYAYLGAQKNEGTITVTMTSAQSDVFNATFAADERNVGVVVDVLP